MYTWTGGKSKVQVKKFNVGDIVVYKGSKHSGINAGDTANVVSYDDEFSRLGSSGTHYAVDVLTDNGETCCWEEDLELVPRNNKNAPPVQSPAQPKFNLAEQALLNVDESGVLIEPGRDPDGTINGRFL